MARRAPTRRTATVEFVRGSARRGRRRALATLPSLFTLANMMCGFLAILVSIRGQYTLAAVLVGLSIVFDITDGAVARLVGAVTPFGLQFDSLRSEEHTSELQSRQYLVCRLLLEKKKNISRHSIV